MYKLNKILVPTDFSEGSKHAYKFARALAQKFGGTVDFVHIIPMLKYLNESIGKLGIPLDMDKDIYPKILADAKKRIKDELEINVPAELRGTTKVSINRKPSDAIVDFASENGYDMVVMGARGSHNNSLFKGSTAEKVIRNSKVPVLTVQGDLPPNGVNRVLVPSDYSDLSVESLKYALCMATSLEAEITILHVLELYGTSVENEKREEGLSETESVRKKLITKFEKYLKDNKIGNSSWNLEQHSDQHWLVQQEGGNRKVKFNTVVLKGISAHYEIVDFASDDTDMIVMATHGRSGLSHLFLGSTTEKVIMSSEIPVLTIRPKKKK